MSEGIHLPSTHHNSVQHTTLALNPWIPALCSSLLQEYHELYGLQRRRLQSQTDTLVGERDLWRTDTFRLAAKASEILHHSSTAVYMRLKETER